MADDIQSYLNGNPLLAGPETAMYRVQKFVHKHAGSVAMASLVAVVIVIGLVVSIIMAMDSGGNDAWFSSKEGSAEPVLVITTQ